MVYIRVILFGSGTFERYVFDLTSKRHVCSRFSSVSFERDGIYEDPLQIGHEGNNILHVICKYKHELVDQFVTIVGAEIFDILKTQENDNGEFPEDKFKNGGMVCMKTERLFSGKNILIIQ